MRDRDFELAMEAVSNRPPISMLTAEDAAEAARQAVGDCSAVKTEYGFLITEEQDFLFGPYAMMFFRFTSDGLEVGTQSGAAVPRADRIFDYLKKKYTL